MGEEPSVAIILLNYCNYQDTISCIETIKKIKYTNYKVFIIDNHSPNESLSKLNRFINQNITVVDSGRNGGFAYGNNIGIRYALDKGFEYFLLLNNDTLVEPDFLTKLVYDGALGAGGDIVTSRIMYNSDRFKVWYAGGEIDWSNLRAVHYDINKNKYSNNSVKEVDFISGCCMLISRKCIEKIGLLPEDYFMYYEDMDFCQHAKEMGKKLVYVPSSTIYHCVSASGGGSNSPFAIEWTNRARRKFYQNYKYNIPFYKRYLIIIKCELREIAYILLKGEHIKGMVAYFKSYQTVMEE